MSPSHKSPLKDFLKTSLPAVVDLSSQTVAWLIEAIFIGHLSAAALAGVGFALQIIILTFTVVLTFVVGASIIIIRYLGAGERWNANHVLAQALMIGTVLAFLISLIWFVGGSQLVGLIREDEPLASVYGVEYLKTVALFGPLIIVNFMALGILRMAGDTMITMKVNLLATILHLTLDPLLIFGLWGFPRLEAQGAALAVGIGHSAGFLCSLYYLRSRKASLFLSFREYTTPNLETFRRLFKLGIPTTVEQLVWAIGQLVLSFYAGLMGVVVLAAHQVFVRIQSVLTMGFHGFGLASMTLVGKKIGAEETHQAMVAGRTAGWVAFLFAILVATVLVVFQDAWFAVFTVDPQVIAFGTGNISFNVGSHTFYWGISAVLILAVIQLPKAVNIVFTGNLRGGADLAWLMWLAVGSVIIFEFLGAYYFSFIMGFSLAGLWVVQGIDESVRLSLNYWRFHQKKWKDADIV